MDHVQSEPGEVYRVSRFRLGFPIETRVLGTEESRVQKLLWQGQGDQGDQGDQGRQWAVRRQVPALTALPMHTALYRPHRLETEDAEPGLAEL